MRVLSWLGPALLFALIIWAGPADLWKLASAADPRWLALAFLLNLPQLGLKAFRWFLLVRWQGMAFSYPRALLAYFSSLLVGFLTPGRLGEMAKAITLRVACRVPLAHALSSVVVDRVFDMYLLLALGSLGIVRYALVGDQLAWPAFIFFCAVMLMSLAFLHPRVARLLGAGLAKLPLLRRKAGAIQEKVDQFADGLAALSPGRIMICAALTICSYYIFFVQCLLTARGLGFGLELIDMALLMAATNFISFIPISISGLGTREVCLVFFLARIPQPQPANVAVTFGLALFLVLFVGGGLIGLASWYFAPIGIRQAIGDWKRARSTRAES